MDQRYIYAVFSSTPYKIGKLIRGVTKEEYNHVSISLDREMTQMYSFSRRFYRLPLYGGFVHETRSRYHINNTASHICVCAIPVTPRQHFTLDNMLSEMHRKSGNYIYNHLSALGAVVHKPIRARDAYTCVEFCAKVLRELGIDIDPSKYYSVGNLLQILSPYIIYDGPMPAADQPDERYYDPKPVTHPVFTTLKDMLRLIPRLKN